MNMRIIISENKIESTMRRYLDSIYGNLTCSVTSFNITWFNNKGVPVAGINRNNDLNRLRLSNEFSIFMSIFSLPWKNPGDDKLPLSLITPYLKFDGGSPAIPILQNLGWINELTHISIPSEWDKY
jgi:hypothetical protein